jgi:hypothetical protein
LGEEAMGNNNSFGINTISKMKMLLIKNTLLREFKGKPNNANTIEILRRKTEQQLNDLIKD